jgi:hypothetical protein
MYEGYYASAYYYWHLQTILRSGLVSKMREKRRGVEYGRQLLGVLAVGFCAPLGEQLVHHRPSGEPTEQSATLLGHGAITSAS